MKILTLILFICMVSFAQAQELTVATFNLRYSIEKNHKSDSVKGEDWARRGPVAASLVRFHEFEIFGTQEGLLHQLEDLSSWLPGYKYVGVGREDGKKAGEYTAVFYKTERFKVLNHGDFWLSETPEKPSMGWDGTCCHRMCTWVHFEDCESGNSFYFFNTHFDHQAVIARKESSKLILQKIDDIAGDNPVIFMGDLNGDHESEWYKSLETSKKLQDTFNQAEDPYAVNGSFNGFGRRTESKSIIDHVFVTKHFKTEKWGILTDTYHGKFPSDHFPVMVELKITN
ncbi:MAG: endonuclease/exonuclease/phosphatase family protein [Cyclobacteriaceae bacterium]|nr:endonuclease/exonuclease/phosphatase family protein [Cyclobacteriaceae bacterium]